MSNLKTFVCSKILYSCKEDYCVTGSEKWVIEEAIKHLLNEHGFKDRLEVRNRITKSLLEEKNCWNESVIF